MITPDELQRLARLAALDVPPAEAPTLAAQLDQIVAYVGQLPALDDGAAESAVDEPSQLRADVVETTRLARGPEQFAPDFADGLFLVPRLSSVEGP